MAALACSRRVIGRLSSATAMTAPPPAGVNGRPVEGRLTVVNPDDTENTYYVRQLGSEVWWLGLSRDQGLDGDHPVNPQASTTLNKAEQTANFGAAVWTKIYDTAGVPLRPWPRVGESA